jgi:Myb-like DNA-binding domain
MVNLGELPFHNISSGNKRWLPEEDDRLIALVQEKQDWVEIARTLSRSFISVQNRFRCLKKIRSHHSAITPPVSTRSQDASLEPDLTCGALSRAGRRVLELAKSRSLLPSGKKGSSLTRTDFVIAALIRELLLTRLKSDGGWLRVTISTTRSRTHGVGREALRSIIYDLERRGLLERHVGYLGTPGLPTAARSGRFVCIRASSRLKDLCEQQGVSGASLFTHFPSLTS